MSLIDSLRGHFRQSDARGWVRMDGLSDEEVDDLALLAAEDAAIAAAEAPPSVVEDIVDIARRLLPAQRPKRQRR